MGIYNLMSKDWKIYCLMSAIIYIEEISKPTRHTQIKKYKNKEYKCLCFHSIRLKMNDEELVEKLFDITKLWENKKNVKLIGKSFDNPRKENFSQQDFFYFTPSWLNLIISECGTIPNKYSLETALDRINHFKRFKKIKVEDNKNLFKKFLKNKLLAAGAFIISMDLEFRGIQTGRPSLCMSEKYKDFLEFMLEVAKKWGWATNKTLSPVNINHSLKRGINASPQYEFRINIKGLQEIYNLAGPLGNNHKNKCIKFHVERSKNYNSNGKLRYKNKTKEKILNEFKLKKDLTSTGLQFIAGVGVDVVLMHLHSLEKKGKIKKERKGKRYIWNIK